MATQPQNSVAIPYRKRIAMGEKLDGTSMQPKQQKQGGLSQPKKK